MSFVENRSPFPYQGRKTLITCPICSKRILFNDINDHLDACSIKSADNDSIHNSKEKNNNNGNILSTSGGSQSVSHVLMGSDRKRKAFSTEVIDLDKEPRPKRTPQTTISNDSPNFSINVSPKSQQSHQSPPPSNENSEVHQLKKIMQFPLSERLRPKTLGEFVGQRHILSPTSGSLYKYIEQGVIPSMILWGPPGVGKTSLARLLARSTENYHMVETSATKANTQELRSIFEKAKSEYRLTKRHTILFIDEIHRFNKSQQDLLLPHVENGNIVLIGATTENPSFQLNNALISRCHVFVLEKLTASELQMVLSRAIAHLNKVRKLVLKLDKHPLRLSKESMNYLIDISVGDTRRALNLLEMLEVSTRDKPDGQLSVDEVREVLKNNSSSNGVNTYYDPSGDNHYDTISAFHKSIRGGDENAALYYLARMVKGGEDPLYIARRMIRIASEDVGLRDNSLLPLAIAAHDAVMKIGLPEADLALAQCCVCLARAPKSVDLYRAWGKVRGMINENIYSMASSEIPLHLRNAPTRLMEDLSYGKGYKYNPDYIDGKVKQEYFPQEVLDKCPDRRELQFLTGRHLGTKRDPDLDDDDGGEE